MNNRGFFLCGDAFVGPYAMFNAFLSYHQMIHILDSKIGPARRLSDYEIQLLQHLSRPMSRSNTVLKVKKEPRFRSSLFFPLPVCYLGRSSFQATDLETESLRFSLL